MYAILAQGSGSGSGWEFLPPIIVIFALMYFLLIRPQRKQEAARRAMIASIRKNDKILTSGGIYGVVTHVADDELTIRVDENVKLRIAREFVTAVVNRKEEGEE